MNDTALPPFAPSTIGEVSVATAWPSLRGAPQPGELAEFLDYAAECLTYQETIPAIWPNLLTVLERQRRLATDETWVEPLRRHPIARLIAEEPATAWAARRPRGYPGDAHLIDFLYEHSAVEAEVRAASPRGQAIGSTIASCTAPVAVQERRRLLARLLDATAERVRAPEALVLACGHLRESELATSLASYTRIMALDQDRQSIAEMQRCYGHLPALVPVEASIGRMIVRPLVHGRFDLIYAAGLYDYLDETVATRLTQGMLTALKPGGRLLFANFCTGVPDYGYMEAFMDWRLLQRDEPEMQRLIDALPAADIARVTVFRGLNNAVIYALIERR